MRDPEAERLCACYNRPTYRTRLCWSCQTDSDHDAADRAQDARCDRDAD